MNAKPSGVAPTRLYLPRGAAARFIKMFIARDTRQRRVTGEPQLNRFPANSYCALTWFLEGAVRLVHCGGKDVDEPMAQCVVNGCLSLPAASRWAGHALATQYADQSQMGRDCKASTGRTPARLARDVLIEEADWIYRLELPL